MHDVAVNWPETQALQAVQAAALDVLVKEVPVPHGEHTVFVVFLQAVPM